MMRPTLAALAIAAAGGLVASAAGLPAGILIGATVAVAIAAAAGLRLAVPGGMRDVAFAALGAALGAGATPDLAAEIARWPLALLVLPVVVAAMMAVSLVAFRLIGALRGVAALLASSPGALSYVIALAEDRRVDMRPVIVLQTLRLFLVTVALPPVVVMAGGGAMVAPGPIAPEAGIGPIGSLVLVAGAFAAGWVLARLRVPAAYLFGGIAVSMPVHLFGWVEGRPHEAVVIAAFLVVGALVGTRLGEIRRTEMARLAGAGTLAALLASAVAAAFAWPVAARLDLPFGQVWIAYAPGGVEAMAAIGLALGYDPVFVALHHVARLFLLAVALPLLIRLAPS
jgi:membrane AbrB-like protein